MIYALIGIGLFGAFWSLLYLMRKDTMKRGAIEKENEVMEEILDDVHLAKQARDNLNNPSVAKRVRDKYTRK
jgi:hypothetical protein